MDAFVVMLKNVIVFVLLAIPGFLLVKTKQLKAEQSGALSKLLMYVGMPFLTVTSTINSLSFDGGFIATLLIVAAIGVAYTFIAFFASKPLAVKEKEEKTRGMMRFSSVFSNNGFLGLPLAIAVFGAGSVVLTVVIIINIITNVLMYTLGIYLILLRSIRRGYAVCRCVYVWLDGAFYSHYSPFVLADNLDCLNEDNTPL